MKKGVVLLNLGGPRSLDEVKPFLYNLFSDPDILVGIASPFRQALAFFISQIKGSSSMKMYEQIGSCSPQYCWTWYQAQSLERKLNSSFDRRHLEYKVVVGMRAWKPFINDALMELYDWNADEIILLPLFPHFSNTTTGSCFKESELRLKNLKWAPRLTKIEKWPDNPRFIKLLKENLEHTLKQASLRNAHILLSAHSLPMKIVERGDRYEQDVLRTVKALTKDLSWPWSLGYQSRNGKMEWLKPYTEDEIIRLAKLGIEELILFPISFVSDHIETLYELDILYSDLAKKHGIKRVLRVPSFNNSEAFTDLLTTLVLPEIKKAALQNEPLASL
ncbi:MAG: ferrochelatase [Bacteriovoracia bacterium]